MKLQTHLVETAKDVSIHCATVGTGPLILFLHGFPEFWYLWRKQLEHFGKSFLAVAPDLRGYNLSSKPKSIQDYGISKLVEDVRRVALHFTKQPFVLVGHDWGGFISFAFAAKYPELLSRLIVINAPHPSLFKRELARNEEQRTASSYMTLLMQPNSPELLRANDYEWLVTNCLGRSLKKGFLTPDDLAAYKKAWAEPDALLGMTQYYRVIHQELFRNPAVTFSPDWFAGVSSLKISVPTRLVWGEQDRALLPGVLVGLEEQIPDLDLVRVPDASHWVVTEKPELISAAIEDWC